MNLDGGGSTEMNVLGVVVNRPSDGTERPVADGIVFDGPAPRLSDIQLKLVAPDSVDLSTESFLEVRDASGARIPTEKSSGEPKAQPGSTKAASSAPKGGNRPHPGRRKRKDFGGRCEGNSITPEPPLFGFARPEPREGRAKPNKGGWG